MAQYVARRALIALALLWIVASVVFFSIHLLPGDPALLILGGTEAHPSPEAIAAVRARLGLDRPLLTQYAIWLARVARGDLGRSMLNDRPVAGDLRVRLVRTLQLVIPATAVAVLVGIPTGLLAARRRGTVLDPLASGVTLLGFSVPVFVTGPLLVLVFSLSFRLLPPNGYVAFTESPAGFVQHLLLPALTLAAAPMATTMRMTRSSVLEQLALDYVRTARAKGLAEPRVMRRHVLRNALLPVLTILGLQVGAMFAGSVLVETIFNWPGMNLYLLQAIGLRDYPVIQGVVLVASVIFVGVNLLTDVGYALLNPRIRFG